MIILERNGTTYYVSYHMEGWNLKATETTAPEFRYPHIDTVTINRPDGPNVLHTLDEEEVEWIDAEIFYEEELDGSESLYGSCDW